MAICKYATSTPLTSTPDPWFGVLDSMRTLADDERLLHCCNTMLSTMNRKWHTDYPNTKKKIDDYEPMQIIVPCQDCGFHMLIYAEHWNNLVLPSFKEASIPNIHMVLTNGIIIKSMMQGGSPSQFGIGSSSFCHATC